MGNKGMEKEIVKPPEFDVFEVGDAVYDGVYLSDKNGVVIRVNKTYSYITGIKASEVMGKNM